MANNPNSFYIGIPCGSTVTVPSYYDGPTTLIYNNTSNVESLSVHADVALNDGSGYAVHFCDALNAMNTAHLAYAHDYQGTQRFMVTDIYLLPPGTRYWVHNSDDYVNAGYYVNYSQTGFGDPGDDGVYVNVEIFGDENTLYSTGSYNNWFYANGKYRFFGNSNSLWKSYEYPVQANHTYTFSLKTYSEASSDGIIISTSSLSSGSVISSGQARAYGLYGTNSTASSTWTYTPTSNGTVYFYFKTDSSVLYGPGGTNGGNGVDYTYGEIGVTDFSPSANNISYELEDRPEIDCTSDAVEAQETDSIKYVTISTGGATCQYGTPTCTLISVVNLNTNVSQSGWNISGTGGNVGTTIIVPNQTPWGVYQCTIRVVSPTDGQHLTQTIDKQVNIYIWPNTATYGNIEDSNGDDGIIYVYGYNGNNIPASAFTLNTSNIGNYVTIDYGTVNVDEHPFTQTINYTNGTSETLNYNNPGAFTFSWVGNSTSFSTKGCVADASDVPEDVSINTMTYRVTGSGGKTYTVGTIDTLPREANVVESSSTTTQYGIPSVTIGNGLTPGTSEAIVTCTVTNTQTTTTTYTSGCQSSSQNSSVSGTAKWRITSKTYTPTGGNAESIYRFSEEGTSSYINGVSGSVYENGDKLKHSNMFTNDGTDYVEITAYNVDDIAKTNTATKSLANTYTDVWGDIHQFSFSADDPTLSYTSAPACGGTVSPSVYASQTGTRTWASGSTQTIYAQLGYSYAMTSGNGFSIDTSSGDVTAEPRGQSAQSRTSNTITLTISGEDNKSATVTATCTQSGNTYNDVIGDVSITGYSYANASACGGTVQPTINASQTITRNWDCNAGPEEIHPTLSYSYDMPYKSGFSIDTSTGAITVTGRGKYDATRSNTATVTVRGSGSKSATATATCTQNGNTYTDSWNNPSISTFSYPYISACGGTVSPTISASQTRTRTWDCNAGTDTLNVDVSNNTIYTKLSGDSGLTVDLTTGNVTGTSREKKTSPLEIIVSVTVSANGKSSTSTANVTQEGNTYTITWGDVNITSYTYPTNPISACNNSSTGNPTVVASQKGTKVWGCNAGTDEDAVDGQLSYSYGITATSGLSINSSTGVITGTAIGKSTTPRDTTATVTVTGSGGKSATKTLTVTQSGNSYTDEWGVPTITEYSYDNASACGETVSPTINATQSGTRIWECNAGTDPLSNNSFGYSYSMPSANGFSINTSTGNITALPRGDYEETRTSQTAMVTVTGEGNQSNTATATCTQDGDTYTISWGNLNIKTFSYSNISACGNTSDPEFPTVSVEQKGTKTWNCSSNTEPVTNTSFEYSYSINSYNFSINSSTGGVTCSSRGATTATRSGTITLTVTGEGNKTSRDTATITQNGNTYTDSWDNPVIDTFEYSTVISAGGGSCSPTVSISQSGTRTWGCGAGTEELTNTTFDYVYGMSKPYGKWTLDTSTGAVSSIDLKTNSSGITTSPNVTITVLGRGLTSTAKANATQEANTVTYGSVSSVDVEQTAYFPREGGTLRTTNIENYFTPSATQTKTWTSGSTEDCDITYSWSGSNETINSLVDLERNDYTERTIDFTVTASGEGGESNSASVTSILQQKNKVVSYGDVSAITVTQHQYYPRTGGTLSTSNIGYYFTPSATQTVTLQYGTRSGDISYSWSGTTVSIPSLNNILATDYTSRNINFRVTATGESNKSQTKNVTTILQQKNEIVSYGEVSAPGVTQTTNFPANGVTLTTSNIGNYFTRSTDSSQTINLQLGSTTGDVTYSWEITNGTVASLGTTATTGVTSKAIDITYTATGEGDESAGTRITSGGQEINALTSISFVTDTKTIAYQDSTTGVVTAYYTSGSSKNVSNDTNTSYDDTSNPDRVSFTKNS